MGLVKGRDPQRFYKYALIDAVDRPYVTFKYRICTMSSSRMLTEEYKTC